jgi:hypothetical protein
MDGRTLSLPVAGGRIVSPPALRAPSYSRGSDSWSAQPRNPVSLRLYKVLGANYDDEGTKDALRTLSDFYAPREVASETIKATQEDDDDWDESEDETTPARSSRVTSQAVGPSTPTAGEAASKARKNLRRDVDRRLAEGSRKFLDAFGEVDQVCVYSRTLTL